MQIFVYETGIDNNNNYPMIEINEEEIINLIKKLDYNQSENKKSKTPYFVINNIQLIPNIDLDEYVFADFPLNIKNMILLYEYKDKFYNKEQKFLEYLNENLNKNN
jgi:hypothetical protein